jgi:hypothetical protein
MWAFATCCRVNFTFYRQFRDSAYICGRKGQDSFPILGVGVPDFWLGSCHYSEESFAVEILQISDFAADCILSHIQPHIILQVHVIPATVQIWARSRSYPRKKGTEHAITSSGNTVDSTDIPRCRAHIFLNKPFPGRRWSRLNTPVHQVSVKFIFGWTYIHI